MKFSLSCYFFPPKHAHGAPPITTGPDMSQYFANQSKNHSIYLNQSH